MGKVRALYIEDDRRFFTEVGVVPEKLAGYPVRQCCYGYEVMVRSASKPALIMLKIVDFGIRVGS